MCKLFLCCYCGIFIKQNIANLKRHEKIHQKCVQVIKCGQQNCRETFHNKSNYERHWFNKHKNEKMPDGLNFIETMPKKTRKMCEKKNQMPANAQTLSTPRIEYQMENVMRKCLIREPFFGKLQYI